MLKTFHIGGIHPPQCKLTAGMPVVELPMLGQVTLMLQQHIGAPARAVVKPGDHVERWQPVGVADGVVSAPVHTPVSGTVTFVGTVKRAWGTIASAVVVKADAVQGEPRHLEGGTDILATIANAGIVGLGGAGFPTAVKLNPPKEYDPDTLIINGAECEPYLTCDEALMLARPDRVVSGARHMMAATGIRRCYIAVEDNKPGAIAALRRATENVPELEVVELRAKYPQGGEKQLIDAVIGKQVPTRALPVATGAIVQNVATAAAVGRACDEGMPLIDRIVTVTGPDVTNPGNYRVPLGMSIREVIDAAGGIPEGTGKVIVGGPMMGRTVTCLDSPVTKVTGGILLLPERMTQRPQERPCIRCAKCMRVCPMGLEPFLIATLVAAGELEEAADAKIANCIECGSCQYICPSGRPLLDHIRAGKMSLTAIKRK